MDAVDVDKAVSFVHDCKNFDGGYGLCPGAESHSGQIYTCVGALSIAKRLDLVDVPRLATWLSERQVPAGGLNGRPEKLEDVCYSWWVASSLAVIGKLHWIDGKKLTSFILKCQVSTTCIIELFLRVVNRVQDVEKGGIADRPGNMVDVFHTVFGLAGLSLQGYENLDVVDPV